MSIAQLLSKYREYHHDHRNVLTHAVGMPLIVLGVTTLLSRPVLTISQFAVTPAMVAGVLGAIWYLRLDLRTGLIMSLLLALFVALGHQIAQVSTAAWLGGGIGLFVVGWIFQLIGHKFEGRKPAFIDDMRSLLIGPLFVLVEGLFALGLMKDLRRQIED